MTVTLAVLSLNAFLGSATTGASPDLRQQILAPFAVPDIAISTLVLGVLLVYLEFNVPGKVLAGASGALLISLSVFGLSQFHVQYSAVLLAFIGVLLVLFEAYRWSYGIFVTVGTVSLIYALAHLITNADRSLAIHAVTAIVLGVAFSAVTLTLSTIAIRARRNKLAPGPWQ